MLMDWNGVFDGCVCEIIVFGDVVGDEGCVGVDFVYLMWLYWEYFVYFFCGVEFASE